MYAAVASQIADRFHLVLNLSATMERVLEERSRKLILPPVNDAAAEAQLAAPGEGSANIQAPLPGPTQLRGRLHKNARF
jgi:hypothetical protein